jgi:4-hydroxybutyryl-CoA dehydratase/vinylacetyl-CoA-Delta-isomerase
MVDTAAAPKTDPKTSPISTPRYYPDSLVIFDDVFVPRDRLFLDGETGKAHIFAHSLGLWERLGGLRGLADDADAMVGFAQLIAEANGLTRVAHVKEKIAEMMAHATLIRATLEAAQANSVVHESGAILADELYVNAGKYFAAANSYQIIRNLQDIAGGSVMTAPSALDLENEDVGDLIRKYMAGADGFDGDYRTALFHAIRDLTADRYGGWKAVGNLQGGGGLYAQRIVIRKHYDLDAAKRAALTLAGIETD